MNAARAWLLALAAVAGHALAATLVSAQDLEPRAYSASPVGANFLVAGANWSTGNVVFDPGLPISDVHADVTGFVVAVGHTFNLFGKLALGSVAVPYALANVTGKVFEQQAETARSGLADARLKLSVNLRGNPAMSPQTFARSPPHTVVAYVTPGLTYATGQHYDTKLINSARTDGFKPEVGISVPAGRWDLDAHRRVALHLERAVLSGRIPSEPGSGAGDSRTRELHRAAAALGRRGRNVVPRRERARRRWRPVHGPEQFAARRHGVASGREALLRESGVLRRRGGAHGNEFLVGRGRLAGVVAEPAMVGKVSPPWWTIC
jgi:hypothetical protein